MRIGIDLSPLQGPHRMRGIGAVLINFINHISPEDRKTHFFVFFVMPHKTKGDPLDLLDLNGLSYDVRQIAPPRQRRRLPGRLNLLVSAQRQLGELRDLRRGHSGIKRVDLRDLEAFLQIDPAKPLPISVRGLKKVLFLHDVIPYVLEWDYLWSYQTARLRGFSRKASLRVQARRMLYAYKLKAALKHADLLLSNSQHTKDDFIRYFAVVPEKITVTHLGVHQVDRRLTSAIPAAAYKQTSWGYLPLQITYDWQDPFVVFVGGADRRRKLQDLVSAFNMLRAQGRDLKLVLVGDSMQGPMTIATEEIQHALRTSSYLDDIIFLGFTPPETLRWIYENAVAFVFPSRYEGFGLPVLEAMSYGTPVIAYDNPATREVAGDIPIYASNAMEIMASIKKLLESSGIDPGIIRSKGRAQAQKFSWTKTAQSILESIGA